MTELPGIHALAGDYPGVVAGAYAVYISANSTVTVTADVDNNIGALIFLIVAMRQILYNFQVPIL